MRRMIKPDPIMNQRNMITYYRQFDPIEKKYGKCFDLYSNDKYDEFYDKCYQYENNRLLSDLTKKEFGDISANLKLVYAEEPITEEIIEIYDLIYDRVINQYLNIDGMERLFSENYINFEWEMHLGIDYAEHSMKFYRDHFIHQVRDAYSMDMLLEHGYAEKIMDILGNEGSSKISRYVCKHVNLQLERKDDILTELSEDTTIDYEIRRKIYLENIIYMSSYMGALFHDIGYPEVANMQAGRNILAYIANVYNFGSGHIDFDRIITVLQNSLLFRVVSPKEIRGRIEDEKIDHGAVSALMFLLHFYENGAIYGLEPYKKCAIELAGLAIYNHTNSYAYISGGDTEKKSLYTRCVFVLNPISYLLRICDDLQEWDRIYFEISPNANIIYCSKCKTPLVRRRYKVSIDAKGVKDETCDVYYLCNCNKKKDAKGSGVFGPVFRRGNFPYRRLYNVTVCTDIKFVQEKKRHIFMLNYDLERLLNVAYINPSYAKYRIKELNQLKRMFARQNIEEMTYITYFISANILFIKAYIVGTYLEKYIGNRRLAAYVGHVFKDAADIEVSEVEPLEVTTNIAKCLHVRVIIQSQKIYEKIRNALKINGFELIIQEYFDETFWIYIYLYLVMRIGMLANATSDKALSDRICRGIENLWELFKGNPPFTDDTLYLLKDCCKQATRMYKDKDLFSCNAYPDKYFEQFVSDKGIEDYFYRFAHSDNYQPVNQRSDFDKNRYKLDAYTDLYLFKWILQNKL